ncbi:MAG: tRNA guanosine transglycosylase [Phycisphaerales bacterium]
MPPAMAITFDISHRDASSRARVGRITTPHGVFDTPAFMPVGTRATIKGLTPAQIRGTGSQCILNNAYHLMLRPGDERVARQGGSHVFMRWDGPLLTDSGGYQAYSMADINAVDEDGVTFKSIVDGRAIRLSPERAIEVQNNLGADIIMAFDDCPPSVDPSQMNESRKRIMAQRGGAWRRGYDHQARLAEANARTVRWLERCVEAHARPHEQALFGIVQGGTDEAMRTASAAAITAIDLPGYAIGGVAVGEGTGDIRRVVDFTAPLLPESKPRYLMGVGYEHDILSAVLAGVDMFDCVLPSRNGRNGHAFTRAGTINLKNAVHTDDPAPIEAGCDCEVCDGGFGRAYLRHLLKAGEMLGSTLVTIHNIRHFQRLLLDIREAIRDHAWPTFAAAWPGLAGLAPGR